MVAGNQEPLTGPGIGEGPEEGTVNAGIAKLAGQSQSHDRHNHVCITKCPVDVYRCVVVGGCEVGELVGIIRIVDFNGQMSKLVWRDVLFQVSMLKLIGGAGKDQSQLVLLELA